MEEIHAHMGFKLKSLRLSSASRVC